MGICVLLTLCLPIQDLVNTHDSTLVVQVLEPVVDEVAAQHLKAVGNARSRERHRRWAVWLVSAVGVHRPSTRPVPRDERRASPKTRTRATCSKLLKGKSLAISVGLLSLSRIAILVLGHF